MRISKFVCSIIIFSTFTAFAEMGNYDLRCKTVDGCAYSDRNSLGYCVAGAVVKKSGGSITRYDLLTERKLQPIALPEVFEQVRGEEVLSVTATDTITYTADQIIIGDNLVEVSKDSEYPYIFNGILVLEEDFGFEVQCTDVSVGLE